MRGNQEEIGNKRTKKTMLNKKGASKKYIGNNCMNQQEPMEISRMWKMKKVRGPICNCQSIEKQDIKKEMRENKR